MEKNNRVSENEINIMLTEKIDKNRLYVQSDTVDAVKKAFIQLFNRLNSGVAYNANVTICSSDQELSNQLGMILAEMLERWFPHSCLSLTEKDFYDQRYKDAGYSDSRILVVNNYTAISLETLYQRLLEIEENKWIPAVILCTNTESFEKLKAYEVQNFRLFHYMCGIKVGAADIGEDNIFELACRRLIQDGYELGDRFKKKLNTYIQAVYPETILTREAFLNDLIYRIYQIHFQTISPEMKMGEKDVPYSRKAEELEQTLVVKKTLLPDTSYKKETRVPDIKSEETHFDDLAGHKNVLILCMSTLPSNPSDSYYFIVDNDRTYQIFSGVSQLEPGTKFFLTNLARRGMQPDKIIILTTKETWKKNTGKSAVDVYAENIHSYIRGDKKDFSLFRDAIEEKLKNDGYDSYRYINSGEIVSDLYKEKRTDTFIEKGDEERNSQELNELNEFLDVSTIDLDSNSLQNIMNSLNLLAKDEPVNLFIDLQGGQRTFMFTMFATLTMLRGKNVTIRDMFAIRYDSKNNDIHPIEIVNNEYAIIDLVSGIRTFTRYGKVDELRQFLQARGLIDNTNETELLEIMEKIDGNMQINNPAGLTDELTKFSENPSLLDSKNYNDKQFKLIVDDLRDVYFPLIKKGHSILDQIKWFAEKSFLTSALTFIEDKIPTFMLGGSSSSIINITYDPSLTENDISKKCGGQNYYRPENNIFNFEFQNHIVAEKANGFYQELCRHWARIILSSATGKVTIEESGGKFELIPVSGIQDRQYERENILLQMEQNLSQKGINVWNPMKLEAVWKLTLTGGGNNWSWKEFIDQNDIQVDKRDTVGNKSFNREKILGFFGGNTQAITQGRISAVRRYLGGNPCEFDLEDEDHRNFLTECVSDVLYFILFSKPQDVTVKSVNNRVHVILEPICHEKLTVVSSITTENGGCLNHSDDYDLDEFRYSLWKELLSFNDEAIGRQTEGMISDKYVCSRNQVDEETEILQSLHENLQVNEETDLDTLVAYAQQYTKCRNMRDSLKLGTCLQVSDFRCSYKNLELYPQLGKEYQDLFEHYFCTDGNGNGLCTIAGIKDGTYNNWLTISIDDSKRGLLNVVVLFYQALKNERNKTNHAEETGNNHMNYRHTRKAIEVFVELCRRLSEM